MKLVLYVNGKKTPYEIDVSCVKGRIKSEQERRINFETMKLRRIGERSGKDWEVYLIAESKVTVAAEPPTEPPRPPAHYSNISPMGIATELHNNKTIVE